MMWKRILMRILFEGVRENLMDNKVYIWGVGENTKYINTYAPDVIERLCITGYIDNNSEIIGTMFFDKEVFSPDVLREQDILKIVIVANRFEKEIRNQILSEYGTDNIKILDGTVFTKIQLILKYENSDDQEALEIVEFLQGNELGIFNYPFVNKYRNSQIDVIWDSKEEMYYIIHEDKRMYFSRKLTTIEEVKKYYLSILLEQDEESPHRYYNEAYKVRQGDIVVDAGVAEGNFSLSIIEKASRIYMFEPDLDWVNALKVTFRDYMDKIVIIPKGISDSESGGNTTIDATIKESVDFIKMDIEGEEIYALKGAKNTFTKSKKIRCAITTYHQELAFEAISNYLQSLGMDCTNSKGYMWYPDSKYREAVLRRGLVFASKRSIDGNRKYSN